MRMIFKKFNLYLLVIVLPVFLLSCSPEKAAKEPTKAPPAEENYTIPSMPATLVGSLGSVFFNILPTNHFAKNNGKLLPPLPLIIGYKKDGKLAKFQPLVAASFGSKYFLKLPKKIQEQLADHKDNLEIAFVVQSTSQTNEYGKDMAGGDFQEDKTRWSSRLMVHAWADPNAPDDYRGARVSRYFLQGIFDSTFDLASKNFPMNSLKKVQVLVHDNTFSPRHESHKLKLSGNYSELLEPIAFFSVVIDDKNPEQSKKAIVTLHWLFTNQNPRHDRPDISHRKLNDYALLSRSLRDREQKLNAKQELKVHDFEAFIKLCHELPFLQKSKALEKLMTLFKK